jgi:nucleoside-diphosphate kinase
MERTFVLIKPDGVARALVGEVIKRIEAKGYRLVAAELRMPTPELLAEHYAEHATQDFYPRLMEFMSSGPLVALVVEGEQAITGFRALAGPTNAINAAPGTIRGDFATNTTQNIVHGSDSPESAVREIALWFPALS